MKLFIIFVFMLIPIVGFCQQPRNNKKPAKNDFMVIGYLQGRNVDTTAIPFHMLTHINFSFAIPAKTGGGLDALRNSDKLIGLVKKAHRNNVQVFISVGGWSIGDEPGDDSRFHRLAQTKEERDYFVTNVMELVRRYNLDGVDVDWEYPDIENRSAEDNVLLMKQLGDSLHAVNKKLTAAVVHYGNQGDGTKKEIFAIVDWLNLMTYDDDKGQPIPHAPYSLVEKSYNYWVTQRGLPAHKAVLGLPFYGKPRGKLTHYKDLVNAGADPYADTFDSVYYNGINTIKKKTEFAKKQKMAGVMIWEISQDLNDDRSLLRAINQAAGKE
ncbi:glycosyl hydrolase family 18 protein [Chryseolinea sp. H1M3-3]|uniref:glycosyl hydrolase family 18 protein n=1 Tax=Chryseolinea sp. H1M3-3 TaxID=3034144 RepID=UPI0023EC3411|nr:glycosyl hydrolase family 18 protein [Chryseolinea sp. H1M3-3]